MIDYICSDKTGTLTQNKMTVQKCFEKRNLEEFGFIKEDGLSQEFAYKLTEKNIKNGRQEKKNYVIV